MIAWTITITNVASGTWPNSRQMNTISSSRVGSARWMSQTHRCHQHMRSSRKNWAFTQPTRKPKTIKPFTTMRKERNRCQWNRGIPQPGTFLPGEDMPRKSLDIKFTDYRFKIKRIIPFFLSPSEGGFGRRDTLSKGISRADWIFSMRQGKVVTARNVMSIAWGMDCV